MEPTKFKEANITFTRPGAMPDCGDLPAYRNQSQIISCWKASFLERLKILFTGRVWIGIVGKAQPPMWLDGSVPFYRATIIDNMKYIISEIRERFSQADKIYHMIAGFVIAAIVTIVLVTFHCFDVITSNVIGVGAGILAGIVKDVVWDKWMKKGTFEIWDMAFTALGSLIFGIVSLSIWLFINWI